MPSKASPKCKSLVGSVLQGVNKMAMGMRRKKGSEFWKGVAQVYGDLSQVKSKCGSCQKAWEVLVDYAVIALGKSINGKSDTCRRGLYGTP